MSARLSLVRVLGLLSLAVLSALSGRPVAAGAVSTPPEAPSRVKSILRDLPLAFEANHGQAGAAAQFVARGDGYALRLDPAGATLSLAGPGQQRAAAIRMTIEGASPTARAAGDSVLPGRSHYLLGNDPAAWHVGIPRYAAVRYEEVYRGVDLVYHGASQRQLEYDFVVAPRTDPRVIRLRFEGVSGLSLDKDGGLVLHAEGGDVTWRAPIAYQETGGTRQPVAARYTIRGKGEVGFRVAHHDQARPLVIDPVLVYSTYFRGSASDRGSAIAVDGAGDAYVTGTTCSSDFPTVGPAQGSLGGGCDAFVTKLSPAGAIVYSTFLGGSGEDHGFGIAVDAVGRAHVVGQTFSPDFPTVSAVQGSLGGIADAFVTKLSPAGDALVYSTYLGGSFGQFPYNGNESGYALAMDGAGNAYVTGFTDAYDFPTVNPLQSTLGGFADAFITKLPPAGGPLVYSTYLDLVPLIGGGTVGYGIAVDGSGGAFVVGETIDADDLAGSPGTESPGVFDAFVARIAPAGNALVYSSVFGGISEDAAYGVALDGAGNATVAGYTTSPDFPTVNPLQGSLGGFVDAFVAKLSADSISFVYSTYLGGSDGDAAYGVALDGAGNAYVTGGTGSEDFPTVDPIQGTKASSSDAFLTEISADGSALVYSTYYGDPDPAHFLGEAGFGVAVDGSGNAHVVGSVDEPPGHDGQGGLAAARRGRGLARTAPAGGTDAFVFKVTGGGVPNQPPDCNAATAAPSILWSPDHTLVPIAITGVTDPEGDPLGLTVSAITQDEIVIGNGTGTGHTCPDATGVGTGAPSVRAERAGTRSVPGDGRVYHIAFTATDPAGGTCSGVATVCVPHDSSTGGTCVDEGALYDSTACP